MPTQARDLRPLLDNLPDMLSVSHVAVEFMKACNCPESGVSDLYKIVECDVSLSMNLLRLANSPLYGMSGQIGSLQHASVVLGKRGLRDLAMTVTAAELFSGADDPRITELWAHSLGCASVARKLGEQLPDLSGDECFVGGLLHDIGKLMLFQVLGPDYDLLEKSLQAQSVAEEERELYGISHCEIGGRCGDDWELPFEIVEAIRDHHEPVSDLPSPGIGEVVYAANQLSKLLGVGTTGSEFHMEVDEVLANAGVALDETELLALAEHSKNEFDSLKEAFGV